MARSRRRKSGWLPVMLPVHSDWRPRVGDSVVTFSPAGDPRRRSTSLDSAYILPPQISVGPLLLSDFIQVASLTDEQCQALQKTLGVTLTKASREEIDEAIHRMAATIALSGRLPGWDAFRKRLGSIIEVGQTCLKAAQQFVQMTQSGSRGNDRSNGALSVDRAVKTYLWLEGSDNSIVEIDIDASLEACRRGLKEVETRASKRGPKGYLALRRFLRSIEMAAQLSGGPTTIPSDSIREHFGPKSSTRFFRFGRECLKIAITNGEAAITAAALSGDERSRASEALSNFGKYTKGDRPSDGAFLYQWRKARANEKH